MAFTVFLHINQVYRTKRNLNRNRHAHIKFVWKISRLYIVDGKQFQVLNFWKESRYHSKEMLVFPFNVRGKLRNWLRHAFVMRKHIYNNRYNAFLSIIIVPLLLGTWKMMSPVAWNWRLLRHWKLSKKVMEQFLSSSVPSLIILFCKYALRVNLMWLMNVLWYNKNDCCWLKINYFQKWMIQEFIKIRDYQMIH